MMLNVRRHLRKLSIVSAIAAAVVVSPPAASQDAMPGDDEAAPTPEEMGWVPAFRVVGFQDRIGTGDCNRASARFGECIEIVDFIPFELINRKLPVWSNRSD